MVFNFNICVADWTIYDVSGENCSPICPMIYLPVCGQDKSGNTKEFGNKCGLDYETCTDSGLGRININFGFKKTNLEI